MSDDRRERLKRFLLELEEAGADERAARIDRLRAEDPELAMEAESLLSQRTRDEVADRGIAEVLEAAAGHLMKDPPSPGARRIGPYHLLELIGTGGMGAVYRARQESPIRRDVAIKLLRGGLDPLKVLARFEEEQRALALADHPGIARILDAGTDDAGTPYLAMELVRGVPITEYSRRRRLRENLDLFISVCRAVQHAHQKGIIHRDLKPSNILVSEVDGKPTAKIIDFGIARVVEEGSSDRVSLTGEGQIVGTLEYMSPEQASGRSREIDTRTDVYSLGAVLYELLTGTVPHDLSGKSLSEAIETIRRDPPRPFRETGVERSPDGDLETITRKALETEPDRRYDGPGALADDLERYLRSEPIVARPPSTTYQLRKLVQRHRTAVLTGGGAVVVLVAFGITMSILYAGQRRDRERAQNEAAKAEAVNRFLQEMLASADPSHLGKDVTVVRVLDRSLTMLRAQPGVQPEVLAAALKTMGTTYSGLGNYRLADSLFQASLRLRRAEGAEDRELIDILGEIARTRLRMGEYDEAERLGRDTLERSVLETGSASDETASSLLTLGMVLNVRGRYPEAESLLTRSSRIFSALGRGRSPEMGDALSELAGLAWSAGDFARSDSLNREVLAIYLESFGEVHPRVEGTIADLSLSAGSEARQDSLYRKSIDLAERVYGPEHPLVGLRRSNFAGHLWSKGALDLAEENGRQALQIWHASLGPDHPWTGICHRNLGRFRQSRGQYEPAEAEMRLALGILSRSWGADHVEVATCWRELGWILADLGRHEEAEVCFRKSVDISTRSAKGMRVAMAMLALGTYLLDRGRADSAEVWLREAMSAAPDEPRDSDARRCALGIALLEQGKDREADSLLASCGQFVRPATRTAMNWPALCRIVQDRLPEPYREAGHGADPSSP